jgi:hypothetical protein
MDRITALPDCNTCADKDGCDHCPPAGHITRINCPLWRGERK